MVTYLPRSAWGARKATNSTGLVASQVEGTALHWPGMAKPIDAADDIGKRRIASALRGWQNYHMDDRGWSDIAYQVAVDQAGRAWTLRGLNIRSGANGDADVNRRFGAILLVLAPGEKPSAAMIATTKGVIADFRRWFPKGTAIKGHRDVRPAGTDCPGPLAYAAIKAGTFTPGAAVTPPPSKPPATGDEIDMATPADVTKSVHDGTASYWRDFYDPAKNGTGAEMRADAEAQATAQLAAQKATTDAVNKQAAVLERIATALEQLAPKA